MTPTISTVRGISPESPLGLGSRRGWILTLFGVQALLVAGYLFSISPLNPSWQLERLLNLDGEGNLPTWFSGVLLFSAALAALGCRRLTRGPERMIWAVLS